MAMRLATAPAAPRRASRLRGDSHPFATSDDNAMMKPILATHAPDGREIPVRPLLHAIQDIFQRSNSGLGGIAHQETQEQHMDAFEERTIQSDLDEMLELHSNTISKISCEISCKCSGGGDEHATTVTIFNFLTSYNWDAKVVLALAAFAVNYGEFWLVAQLYLTNPLAKAVAFLKQLPVILEHSEVVKPKFEALNTLMNAMLNVAKCIVEFGELPPQYITADTPEMVAATAHIPTAAYWTIRSIVACESQIRGLLVMGHEYITFTTEAWELSTLAHKVSNIHSHLMEKLAQCYQHIDEKRHNEAYQLLIRLMETPHIDNMKILKALIYAKDDQLPLFDGSAKRRASIDVLRRKNVLLFISDLDLAHDELFILEQMYQESRQHPSRTESMYDIVWLPVVERSVPWDEGKQKQFETLQLLMLWYSVYHPSLLDPAVIRYIKEYWHFTKKPLLVVIDTQGKVVNQNAIHMIWIWGSQAFPFTSLREEELWKGETWRIDLLADNIDPALFNWIAENKYICLYGGEDIEWIRKFTRTAQGVAKEAQIPLEILYVGKSNLREKARRNNALIQAEKLSHVLQDITLVWFFWVRIESMWHSKVKHGKSVENDPIVQEIMTMLSFDGSDQGWAVFSRGSAEMARAKGDTIYQALTDYDTWKNPEKGFVDALNDHLQDVHTDHHCNRLILPGTTGGIPERIVCAECGRPMEKFLMYRCCTD